MNHDPLPQSLVFESERKSDALEQRFVLQAVGIPAVLRQHEQRWQLLVPTDQAQRAGAELQGYASDQAEQAALAPRPIVLYQGAALGVMLYTGIIGLFFLAAGPEQQWSPWFDVGSMYVGPLREGQWWRLCTALTLHANLGHLLSNAIFGGIFGFIVGRALGGGVGWLSIVLGAILGNLGDSLVRDSDFRSIGASTAVFAALGILVAHALRRSWFTSKNRLVRLNALIGGTLLLAMTGVGGQTTDVGAHAAGFISGGVVGYLACLIPERILSKTSAQVAAGTAAIGLVVLCWFAAAKSLS